MWGTDGLALRQGLFGREDDGRPCHLEVIITPALVKGTVLIWMLAHGEGGSL
jgi:hypothetical protein